MSNYWSATDDYLREHDGEGPMCPTHGTRMFAADDHGRFSCFKCGLGSTLNVSTGLTTRVQSIPQVPADVPLTDEQKAKIPGINRLEQAPTKAESEMIGKMLKGEDYSEAMQKVAAERKDSSS